jgi:hypothetical protein
MTTAQYEKTIKELTDKVVELERKNCELQNDLFNTKNSMSFIYRGVCERFVKLAENMDLDYEEKIRWDYALIDDWVKNSNWVMSCEWKDFLYDYCILNWELMYDETITEDDGYNGVYRKEWTDSDGNKKIGPRIYLPDPYNE